MNVIQTLRYYCNSISYSIFLFDTTLGLMGEEKEYREGTHDHSIHESRHWAWSDDTHGSLQGKPWPPRWCSRGSSSRWSLHRPDVAQCRHLLEGGCHWARQVRGFHSGFLVCRRWAWHPLPCLWSGTTPHPHDCHKEGDLETHQIGGQCSSRAHSDWCKQNKDLGLGMKRTPQRHLVIFQITVTIAWVHLLGLKFWCFGIQERKNSKLQKVAV